MPDLLIPLYGDGGTNRWAVPEPVAGVTVRRALAYERRPLLDWVEQGFGAGWAGEVAVALSAQPASCLVALCGTEFAGFCCYDATYRGFLGPLGVVAAERGRGVGRALLVETLLAMWHAGYAYAVVGAVGAVGFYEKVGGMQVIRGSTPGPYPPRLRDLEG